MTVAWGGLGVMASLPAAVWGRRGLGSGLGNSEKSENQRKIIIVFSEKAQNAYVHNGVGTFQKNNNGFSYVFEIFGVLG